MSVDDRSQIVGLERTALNVSDVSIHDDAEARRMGFRGAAVAASVHLDIFGPPLVEAYGQAFYERGAISYYSLNVVVSGEQIQAVVERPITPGAQVRAYARRADDHDFIVCQGTGSIGDHSNLELATRDLRLCDDGELRMLKGAKRGMGLGRTMASVDRAWQAERIATGAINEAMEWHLDESPWGGPIATLSSAARMMFTVIVGDEGFQPRFVEIFPAVEDASGMFGAIEVAFENGPVLLDREYEVEGRVVGVGQSPKTEYLWWDATARDDRGVVVARTRHLQRLLKASSPLYPEIGMG